MNRTFKLVALVLITSASLYAQERFANPRLGFGFVAGGAQGANSSSDKTVLHYGGFAQYKIFGLLTQSSVQFNKLMADDYWAKIAYLSQSVLIVPYSTQYFNPFVSLGFGIAKPVYRTGTSYIGLLPFGAGVQTKFSPNVLMQFELFYVYALSDSLDGQPRSKSDLNPLTNGGRDSFYGARIGLVFGAPSGQASSLRSDHVARKEMEEMKESYDSDNESGLKSVIVNSDTFPDSEIVAPDSVKQFEIIRDAKPVWEDLSQEQKIAEVKRETSKWKIVGFAFGQVHISPEADAVLREVLQELQRDTAITVYVVGHSDGLGNEKVNRDISLYRANLVKKWLVDHSVAEERLQTLGKGSEEPLTDNHTDAGRALNRRVEFWKK